VTDEARTNPLTRLGARLFDGLEYLGGMGWLLADAVAGTIRGLARRKMWSAAFAQMNRVVVKSLGIVMMVQVFIGIILALQMAPTLRDYGQLDKVANIVAIAIFRELGPLITAIVLSGFAGASIAAEIGTMVVAEEIEALRAHALDPIRFLVVPRVLATFVMTVCLAVVADLVGVLGGFVMGITVLGISPGQYYQGTIDALTLLAFLTGLVKAGIFGLLISTIACHEGLGVTAGAEGVGKATTRTVVLSIVSLIAADCLFTAVFYAHGW
jgi:phospholipid/cholesterol/gamma-HCH transport system permease protein